ncbi:DUF3597 domain-containing protein [Tsuneonella sp. HG222]
MSIFSKIKDAILGRKEQAAPTTTSAIPMDAPASTSASAPAAPKPQPAPVIDVENHLDALPGATNLNWRTSIVDLMKLIGVDSDYDSRKALAEEMGRSDYSGTAEDNVWLHRRVMQDLSKSGGRVPAEYID